MIVKEDNQFILQRLLLLCFKQPRTNVPTSKALYPEMFHGTLTLFLSLSLSISISISHITKGKEKYQNSQHDDDNDDDDDDDDDVDWVFSWRRWQKVLT